MNAFALTHLLPATLALALALPAMADNRRDEYEDHNRGKHGHDDRHGPRDDHWDKHHHKPQKPKYDERNYFHRHGYSHLDIPVAYYPPAGWCRIWYPGRPSAHQPPPVACGVMVPAGAWLLEHPAHHEHVYVRARDEERSGASIVGEFRISDGAFVRIVLD